MWIRKIKRKKLQFFLISVILFFAAAIFSGCLLFSTDASVFIKHYFSREKNYDTFTCIESKDSAELIMQKAAADPDIAEAKCLDSVMIHDAYKLNGEASAGFLRIFSKLDNYKNLPFAASIYMGEEAACPKDNEVWVTKVYAHKNKVKIGDVMTVNGKALTISAIMKCAISPSSTMSFTPIFLNDTTYNQLSEDKNYAGIISLKSIVDENYTYDFVKSNVDNQNLLFIYNRSTLLNSMFGISMTGGIGMVAAVMIFVVSIVIIKFIINNNLMKEYRSIGIHKALGDSNRTIKGYYLKAYLFIGLISITIGSIAGIPIAYYVSLLNLDYIDRFQFSNAIFPIITISILLLMLILTLNLLSSFKAINKITPVAAIRMGITSSKKKLRRSLIENAYSPLSTAVNDIAKHRGSSILLMIMLAVSFIMSISFVNFGYSITKIPEQGNKWFLTPKTDATVAGNTDEKVQEYIKNSHYVKDMIKGKYLVMFNYGFDKEKYTLDMTDVNAVIYDDWSYDKTKINFDEGHGPANQNEIAFSEKLLNNSSLKVGDYIELSINNIKNTFLITGSFTTMVNNGFCIAYHSDLYKLLNKPDTKYDFLFVNLKNKDDYVAFKQDVTSHFENVSVDVINEEIKTAATSVVDILVPVFTILIIVFILFSLINIINLLALENLNNRRQFGILKSLGFSTRYICMKCIAKTMLLTLLSILFALAVCSAIMRKCYQLASSIDSFVFSIPLTVILIGVTVIAIFLITMAFCLPLRKIKPRDLMEE